ncbi:non-ribosomal peptide synthetase [Paenibacillus tarimensis]|uniref:non-ribosomal peptide synthetase n=1 Tax=Paenibacillus tarimensis TaxID=416012 RepID=UPI001F3E3065|nr:non-ribosomal peptide synthetase [Paenibacillus tarimensis]MCF2946285.1 amino acid adenylation domain-containing protein [Paenibacillus tarimensis]
MKETQIPSRTAVTRDRIRKELAYWRERLEDGPMFSSIAGDQPRSREAGQVMEGMAERIPPETAARITAAAKQSEAGMYMILLSGVTWLLAYYGGTEDVMVAMPGFHRRSDASGAMGAPCLPLRITVEGQLTYREWLMKNRSLVMEADEHKGIPFAELLTLLGHTGSDILPVWTTAVYMEGVHQPEHLEAIRSDLVFGFYYGGGGISLRLSYNAELYSEAFAAQLARHLFRFYEAALAEPGAAIGQIEVIGEEERQQLLHGSSHLTASYPEELTLHGRFEEMAAKQPDRPAVRCEGRALTYRELNERANRLAWTLRAGGLAPEALVAVMMDRSEDMLAAMLGIMKAGGAYVPVDPEYPADRIAYTLADSGAAYLVTSGSGSARAADLGFTGTVIDLSDTDSLDTRCSNPVSVNTPDHLCYIIYTSGTTGRPKGVMIEHRNVIRLLFNDSFAFDFGSRDVWTLFHSVCFDFSVWEMYGALLYGGRLVVVPKETARDPREFTKLLRQEQVTVLNQTPTAFYYVIEELRRSGADAAQGLALRYVIFGGEALKPAMLAPFRQLCPDTKLVNMYGITETTVHVTYKELTSRDIEVNASNIGRPIPTLAAYIMDGGGRLMPAGVVGELYVGGAGVGRGYLNRPELTAERFIDHPHKPGERLYRTGDLAKIRLDGDMEYYGRIDHQVKIRGHRIELGEVESVFMRHPSVKEAIAIAADDAGGQTHICVYYASDEPLAGPDMREYASGYLPEYMVPSSIIKLENIPLTGNGKVDRRRLPDPFSRTDEEAGYTAPATSMEARLCGLYQELFGLERVGAEDSFFGLGGDSIRALRLIGSISDTLGVQLQIKDLYMHPVIRDLAAHLESAGGEGMSLLLLEAAEELAQLKREICGDQALSALLPAGWEDLFPMSDIQAGMIYDNMKNPDEAHYHDQMPFPLQDDSYDETILRAALAGMARKHGILRTVFDLQSFREPVQIVLSAYKPAFEAVDLTGLQPADQQERIDAYMKADRQRGFDLGQPLWRICVFQLDRSRYILLFICHHAILDGWSVAAFVTELTNAYYALKAGGGPAASFQPLQSSYKTFVTEQRAIRRDAVMNAYWSQELEEYKRLKLPVRNSDEPEQTAFYEYPLSGELNRELAQLANRYQTSLKHICFALYTAVMSLLSRDNDLLVGMVEHNRPAAEDADRLLGCFLNTVPVRQRIEAGDTWQDLLVRTDAKLKELKHYGRLPLAEVMKTAGAASGDGQPLFDTFFNYIDFHVYNDLDPRAGAQSGNGVQVEGYVRNDILLDFTVVHHQGEIKLSFMYSTRVFTEKDVRRLAESYVRGAELAVREERAPFRKEMLLAEEERQWLRETAEGPQPAAGEQTVTAMFEEQARLLPMEAAVVSGEQQLTYGELLTAADQAARALAARGIGRGDRVALVFKPDVQMAAAMLAVLRSGAAYVPVDPSNPAERTAYVLEDSRSSAVLTADGTLEGVLPEGCEVLEFGKLCAEGGPDISGMKTLEGPQPDDPAYIIYTSGTTGTPKGVVIRHRGLANYVNWFIRSSRLDNGDSTALLSSYSFDLGYTAVFPALCAGIRLHLPPKDVYSDPEQLLSYLEEQRITLVKMTPSLFGTLVQSHRLVNSRLDALRLVVLGGEALHPGDVERFRQQFPNTAFMNHYGPSETTIGCAAGMIPFERWAGFKRQPVIGRAIDHTRIYVLDVQLQPLRPGVTGELYVAGEGLAEGYLGMPELTAERFVTADVLGRMQRLYRTGDLGCYTEEGMIAFHGRADGQVKIRGYRVEPGGIEAKLLAHEAVAEAAVVPYTDPEGRTGLAAYLTAHGKLSVPQLRSWLAETLPDYMIPSSFTLLERMPLTGNGKLDRKGLPAPGSGTAAEGGYTPPGSTLEKTLAQIWEQVLGITSPGIHDNFFELGGDSIKAIQVSSRLYAQGLRIELRNVMKHPTIAGMSKHITTVNRVISQGPVEGEVSFTPIIDRFLEQPEEVRHHYNQSVMLHFREGIAADTVRSIFDKLTLHHDALRMVLTRAQTGCEGRLRLYNKGPDHTSYKLIVRNLRHVADPAELVAKEAEMLQSSISLEEGPLVQLGLFQTAEGDHLLVAVHHLAVDGVSWRILFEDILTLHGQAVSGEPLQLPGKTDSFQYWAEELAAYSRSSDFRKQAAYWRAITERDYGTLPTDDVPADNKVHRARSFSVRLTEELTAKLLRQAHHAYGTDTNDLLLAALGLACRDWCGMDRLLVELEGHGREDIGRDVNISRTVGWFTAVYPVALELQGLDDRDAEHGGLSAYVKRVKEQLRQIPGKGLGYGLLNYMASEEEEAAAISGLPEPEISFNYLGQFDQDVETGVFGVSPLPMGSPVHPHTIRRSKLDLTGIITGGCLEMTVHYNGDAYKEATIRQFAEGYRRRLEQLINHCAGKEAPERTPSDYGSRSLSIAELELLERRYPDMEQVYPLSPMQSGLLFHSLMNAGSEAYFEQFAFVLRGKLDFAKFEQSFNELLRRHDIFRTAFVYEGVAVPQQVVRRHHDVSVELQDIRHMPKLRQKEHVELAKRLDREQGFDLAEGVLMRMILLQIEDEAYQVLWSHHHIVMDGWCMETVTRDLLEAYRALVEGTELRLEPAKPYADYIRWLEGVNKDEGLAYWREALQGYSRQAALPRTRRGEGYSKQEYTLEFGVTLTRELERLARQQRVTMYTVLQTLWGIILQRYNGTDDVVFGSVVSGRPPEISGIETMVGLFINTVPVRIRSEDELRFSGLLQKVQEASITSKAHEFMPLAEIQGTSALKQDLVDMIMVYENYPVGQQIEQAGGEDGLALSITDVEIFEQTNYDLDLTVIPEDTLQIKFTYNAAVYDPRLIEQAASYLLELAGQVTVNPEVRVGEIRVPGESGQAELLQLSRGRRADYPLDVPAYRLIEAQAALHPEQAAVLFGGEQISYRSVNEHANRMARYLRRAGARKEELVAVLLERSPLMLEAYLAIWKAGGAYVPIDPEYPAERQLTILRESGARYVLTEAAYADKLQPAASLDGVNMLCLDKLEDQIGAEAPENLELEVSGGDLAYVIYTSGSTGTPKGTMIEHAGMLNHMLAEIEELRISAGTVLAQNASHCFDVSVWQFFAALLVGGSTAIYPNALIMEPERLISRLQEDKVSILEVVPSYLAVLLDAMEAGGFKLEALRYLMITGETVKPAMVGRWFELCPDIPMINAYGPAEASDDVSQYVMTSLPDTAHIPVGRPIPNMNLYVVDEKMRLCPAGAVGEICVSGIGVGRGYLNDKQRTEAVFMEDPFTDEPGVRLYRTGDLGRWLPDGTIEFYGRRDYQVKIRGFRIELGEIEARLTGYAGVREAVVTDFTDKQGNQALCAYIEVDPQILDASPETLTADAIRSNLAQQLPDYMVPAVLLFLDRMPLSPNGKVDRKALPSPDSGLQADSGGYEAPRSGTEEILAAVWADVLGVERVGIRDHFFSIGGDSIKAIQVVSRLYSHGLKLEMRDLFQYPQIAQLSLYVQAARSAVSQEPVQGEVRLTPIQESFFRTGHAEPSHYNQSVMLYRAGGFNEQAVKQAWLAMVKHHDALRMIFRQENDGITAYNRGIDEDEQTLLQMTVHELRGLSESKKQEAEAIHELAGTIQRSMDIRTGPLVRLGLFRTDSGDHLLAAIHHLVVDGVSWRILLEDFELAMRQQEQHQAIRLPDKTVSYKRWSELLEAYGTDKAMKAEADYWRVQDQTAVPRLPRDNRLSGPRLLQDSAVLQDTLPAGLTRDLLTSVHHAYNTEINDLLLTALAAALTRWTGCSLHRIAMEGHGREELLPEMNVNRTVGWFTSVFPVLLEAEGGEESQDSPGIRIRRMKEALRKIPNKGAGYGRYRQLSCSMAGNVEAAAEPQAPEIVFNYLGQFDNDLATGVFEPSAYSGGYESSGSNTSEYALDIAAVVENGQLAVAVTYNRDEYREETIRAFTDAYLHQLEALIRHCKQQTGTEQTPTDVGYEALSLEEFDELSAELADLLDD